MVVASEISVKPRVKMTKFNKNNKINKSLLIVEQELKLARVLAGNNKALRDRTLKKLKKWFAARETQMPFTEDDFMRLWKGLFYYMWMSDKPLIQEECAENISKLADFTNTETSLLFFKCFLKTMIHEWFGIDNLRLDKFLMLVRRVLRQEFKVLDKAEWDLENVTEFQNVLNDTVFNLEKSVPLSLSMHVAEIYLEELAKVSKGNISEEIILELTKPFALQVAFTKDGRLNQHIKQYVFRYLINQSDPGIEYQLKFDAWRQLGFPGGTIDAMEKVDFDNSDNEDNENQNDADMPEIDTENAPLDPRAGKVHVDLPQLKFDPLKIAEMLEKLKLNPKTTSKTRRQLNNLAQQFRILAKGEYPFGLKKVHLKPKNEGPSTNIKSSLKRLQRFEQKLLSDSSKSKHNKMKNKKIKQLIQAELEKYEDNEEETEEEISESLEDFISKSEEGLVENQKIIKNNKKVDKVPALKKAKKRKLSDEQSSTKVQRIQRNSGVWEIDELDDLEESTFSIPDEETSNENWTLEESENEKPTVSKKIKTNKKLKGGKKVKTDQLNGDVSISDEVFEENPTPKKVKVDKNSPNKKKASPKHLKKNSDTEISIPFNGTDVFSTPKSLRGKNKMSTPKSVVKNPFSTPVSSAKKVKIALDLNRSQEHSEYHESIISSPGIPYDAEKKPSKPLLKKSRMPIITINPFYRR